MPSILPNYEYDIFISYRHNDNLDGWVTEFVQNLEKELRATLKESVTIYFDKNPHDGLLETHHVDKSLKDKLKCLILIPIISQTYCDTKSFAWPNEFCVFNKQAQEDQFGRDIKLSNGNVASRILPVKIHDLDDEDKRIIESETGSVLRSIDFIYKEPGVNRPLKLTDSKNDNQNKTDYQNQINRVANAVKELIYSLTKKEFNPTEVTGGQQEFKSRLVNNKLLIVASLLIVSSFFTYWYTANSGEKDAYPKDISDRLDKAEKYLEESSRFEDDRYSLAAIDVCKKVLAQDSLNERALSIVAMALCSRNAFDSSKYYVDKILSKNPNSVHGLFARAELNASAYRRNYRKAIDDLKRIESIDPKNEKVLSFLSGMYREVGDYVACWQYAKRYEQVSGEILYGLLSDLFLELGDFPEALRYLTLKERGEDLACHYIESYQKIYLCAGDFKKLEIVTDSICEITECKTCPSWQLRSKMHAGNFEAASKFTRKALQHSGRLNWRIAGYVLNKVGKKDSAMLVSDEELKTANLLLHDSTYHLSLPYYSKAAIYAMRGDYQESMVWLRKYAEKGFVWASEWYIENDPLFEGLKQNPHYFPEFMQIVNRAQARKMVMREKIKDLQNEVDKN
jgi:hypothetical protein